MEEVFKDVNPAVVALVSAFIPLVIAVINRYKWSSQTTALVDFVIIAIIGAVVAIGMGVTGFEGIAAVVAAIYGLSQAAFHGVYQPTGAAQSVEHKTG